MNINSSNILLEEPARAAHAGMCVETNSQRKLTDSSKTYVRIFVHLCPYGD
jgi:hypothetical protein